MSRKLGAQLVLAILISAVFVVAEPVMRPAFAHCNGSQVFYQEIAQAGTSFFRGVKANILVNQFSDNHQWSTARLVAVAESNNDYLELGWTQQESRGGTPEGYRTWATNGQLVAIQYKNAGLTRGARHEFRIHDSNDDNYWSTAINGTPWATNDLLLSWLNNGWSLAGSERLCSMDSAYGEFRVLQKCQAAGCSWTDWNYQTVFSTTDAEYQRCPLSITSFDVRLAC